MYIKTTLKSLLIGIILLFQSIKSDNFIFDLGGVLIDTNSLASLRHVGLKNIAQCMIYLKKGPATINKHLKTKLFETLNNIAYQNNLISHSHYDYYAYDEHGNRLPYLMCTWLNGTMTNTEIRTLVISAIERNPQWFNHKAEQQAITNLVTMVFTPEHFVATRKIYKNSIGFIKACKKQGHSVYALSNWDAESFALLQEKYSYLFDLFDGIIISGDSNLLKPSPQIYTTLLDRYNLIAEKCWFIDDQKENVAAACALGINGIICTHSKYYKKPNFHLIAQNIKNYNHKSVTRRENRKNIGIKPKITKNTNNPIIVGEKIS